MIDIEIEENAEIKQRVREFYDSVGWKQIGEGVYQNARYEDLRPVTQEYIHKAHLRVACHLPAEGKYLLDAGSGPIQYPDYLEYSRGFQYRVCMDISIRALREARERIGNHGLFVVGDLANLPFKTEAFEAEVSLHAVHHLPPDEHRQAYYELYRSLAVNGKAVVVTSWGEHSSLMRWMRLPMDQMRAILRAYQKTRGAKPNHSSLVKGLKPDAEKLLRTSGTFTAKHDYKWTVSELDWISNLSIWVWRSVNTNFLRAFIHRRLFGRELLRALFWFEERAPHYFGRIGQYPMIVFEKPRSKKGGTQ